MNMRTIWAVLVVLALLLSACGGDGGAEEAATATPITEAATATPTVAEEATPTTASETTTVTETETMTETEVMTETEGVTGAEELTDTEGMTETEGITGAEELTDTESMTGTGTSEATPTAEAGGTDVITGTEGMTSTSGVAETGTMTSTEDTTSTGTAAGTAATTGMRGVVRATELLGYGVENFEGENLGSINDAMISLPDGCIDYMILSFGGILGLGDNLFLIPWRVVTIDPVGERLVLNAEPEVLNDAPFFDVDNLPDFASPDWDAEVRSFWENIELLTPDTSTTETMTATMGQTAGMGSPCAGALPGFAAEDTQPATSEAVTGTTEIEIEMPRVIRLSELMSFDVTNSEGEDLGAIEDIMIDWRQDRIVYAILSFGGILGLGEKWFPIPLDQVRLDPIEQRFIFDVEPERLENAPGFDEAELPDTRDPNWDQEIRNYWTEIR